VVSPVSVVSVIVGLALSLVSQSAARAAGVEEAIHSEPFRTRSGESPAVPGRPLFTRLGPESTRLSFLNRIAAWHEQKRLYLSSFAAGSVAIGDLDGDGLSDIFVAGGAEDNRLYLQADNLTFLDITAGLPIEGAGRWSAGTAIVDIDNDGDNDLYVCHYDQPNQLFINQTKENGKLSFSEYLPDADAPPALPSPLSQPRSPGPGHRHLHGSWARPSGNRAGGPGAGRRKQTAGPQRGGGAGGCEPGPEGGAEPGCQPALQPVLP
jgi:hypothetical protein